MKYSNNMVRGLAALATTLLSSTAFAQDGDGGFEITTDRLVEWGMLALPYVLKAVGALIIFWFGRSLISKMVRGLSKVMEKRGVDETVARFTGNLLNYALLAGLVLGILGYFDVDTTSFAALIGAVGLAVGMALQGTLGNFAAGVMLLLFKPFKVDDFVSAGGTTGIVMEIGIFTTTIKTLDNQMIIVPNGKIFGDTITNVGALPKRRVDIDVGCDYSADIDETRATLEKALENIPGRIADPDSQIFLVGLGASSVDWQVRVWCKTEDYWAVHEQTVRAIKIALDEKGIGIPFPQMDVHLDKLD